jgi:hypothetical protein
MPVPCHTRREVVRYHQQLMYDSRSRVCNRVGALMDLLEWVCAEKIRVAVMWK